MIKIIYIYTSDPQYQNMKIYLQKWWMSVSIGTPHKLILTVKLVFHTPRELETLSTNQGREREENIKEAKKNKQTNELTYLL